MDWRADFPQDHAPVDWAISGLPGDLDVQQLLSDTEEKLKMNACSIEQSLRELEVQLDDSWTEDRASTPADILQLFSPQNLTFLKPTCTGQQQLLDFLRALQQFLRTEEKGREEAILQLLLDISSQCGVAFPKPAPLVALHPVLGSPVHAVREEAAIEVQEVWDDVRLLLRRHLLAKLGGATCRLMTGTRKELQKSAGPEGGGSEPHTSQRAQRLQQLLFLYPEAEVLSRYRGVRVKAVQEVLQQGAQSSSPAQTGFGRLACSFGTASPALLRLVEEDLRALSTVVEPAASLAFINHAHLDTVAREMSVAMEKLVEDAAKDSSTSSGKARKASAKSRVAVAPQEEAPRRGMSLTSHQLGQLTRLAGALLDLEERVEGLAADLGLLCCAGETPCSVRGILKRARDDPETTLRESSRLAPEISPPVPEATALQFGWRSAFRELAPPLVHCVRGVLEEACAKRLQEEAAHASGPAPCLALTSLPQAEGPPVSSPASEPPKMIAKFAGDIMAELDALFPLALACRGDSLLDVRASFIEVVGRVMSAILGRLQERGREVPASAPLRNLPALLATGVFLQQRLLHYQARLGDPTRRCLSLLPIPKCQEVTEALQEHLTGYCVQACSTCILQDPESHHWGDPKPFYEGERCSFSIQMWHYFMSGLRSDLWACLPPSLAQEVLAQVLSPTLEVLVQRYSRARPSYTRTQQIRTDIRAILLCVEQLILGVCGSAPALLRSGPWDGPWVSSIHSLCDQLLGVLAVVTSPLPDLHRHFSRDRADGPPSSQTETPSYSQGAQWLCHINPTLFSEESLKGTSGADTLAAVGWLRLLCAQPDCSHALLLRALLQADCVLLQVLLGHPRLGAADTAETRQDGDAVLEAVFSVLSSLNAVPKALALVFEGYLDRRHLWDHLYNLADCSQSGPVVLRCLKATVAESIDGIVGKIVAMVRSWVASEDHASILQVIPESVLSKIPKEWNYTSQNPQEKESANGCTRLLVQALSFVFSNLPPAVASLPLPVRFLFHTGEERLSQSSGPPGPAGPPLGSVVGLLCQRLEEGGAVERMLGRRDGEKLALVSDCLRAATGLQRGAPKPATHKALQALEERSPKWSSTQLQKARKLYSEGVFEAAESSGAPERAGSGVPELTERKIGLMVLELRHKAGGARYLRQIHHIIRLNEELLASRLSAPTAPVPPHAPSAALRLDPPGPRPRFNPIAQFNRLGAREFDQSAISDWSWDWARLLPAYQSVSQVTLGALLANRWDLQDGAVLEDEERALADGVRKAHFSAGPGS